MEPCCFQGYWCIAGKMTGYCVFECKKIGLKRDLRCTNPCKSGDGSYLKKLTSPPKGASKWEFSGVRKSKVREISWTVQKINNICFYPSHPGGCVFQGGGGWGSKFQKSGKFHELSRKSIKKITPPPTKGGRSGNFRGSKKSKVREMSWTAEKSNNKN